MSEIDYQKLPPEARLRLYQVLPLVGMAPSTVFKKVAEGIFPRPRRDGTRNTTWSYGQILQYLKTQAEE